MVSIQALGPRFGVSSRPLEKDDIKPGTVFTQKYLSFSPVDYVTVITDFTPDDQFTKKVQKLLPEDDISTTYQLQGIEFKRSGNRWEFLKRISEHMIFNAENKPVSDNINVYTTLNQPDLQLPVEKLGEKLATLNIPEFDQK